MQARVNHKSGIRNHKLMIALCLMPYALYAPGAGADLASTGYSDAGDTAVLNKIGTRDAQTGNWETTAGDGTTIVGAINAIKAKIGNIPANSSIAAELSAKADANLGDANHAVTTGSTGALQSSALLTGGQIASNTLTNVNFAGGLDMAKIDMPTNCTGQCMLVYKTNEQKYVWEELTGSTSGGNGGGTSGGLSADYCVNLLGWPDKSALKCDDLNGDGFCASQGATNASLGTGGWSVQFSYGTVTGIASCNSTAGDNQRGTWTNPTTASSDSMSSSSTGQYCWCKMTGFAGQSLSVAPWVFNTDYDLANFCASFCAYVCADTVATVPVFRGAIYNASGITDSGNGACYQ